jgi:hypothetical protein
MALRTRKVFVPCRLDAFLRQKRFKWVLVAVLLLLTLSAISSAFDISLFRELNITDIIDDEIGIDSEEWSKLKIAVYMTTHVSKSHIHFLKACWPFASQNLKIFHDADLILYASEQPDPELIKPLQFRSVTVKLFPQLELPVNATRQDIELVKQTGAKRAMTDPFEKENHWFDEYDWVIRLNPDVLVRREKWLRQTMLNKDIDGIFINYHTGNRDLFQTDFFAFRPAAMDRQALFDEVTKQRSAEMHLGAALQSFRTSGRWAAVPGTTRIELRARVLGRTSPVIHDHLVVRKCPNYFDATDGEWY